jgi:hypothetical protein
MDTVRLRNLVSEYKSVKVKLEQIKASYERTKITFEIAVDLAKEFEEEIRMAKEANSDDLIKYWQDVKATYFTSDKELSTKEQFEKAEEEILRKNEKLISYYEKKLKVVRKHLGARLTQLLENYEERNILMGEEFSSKKFLHAVYEEDDAEIEKKDKERRNSATFDKM